MSNPYYNYVILPLGETVYDNSIKIVWPFSSPMAMSVGVSLQWKRARVATFHLWRWSSLKSVQDLANFLVEFIYLHSITACGLEVASISPAHI